MKRGFQIIISKGSAVGGTRPSQRLGWFHRLKFLLAGMLFTSIAVAALIVILVLGSIIAAIIWIALMLAIVGVTWKASLRRVHSSYEPYVQSRRKTED